MQVACVNETNYSDVMAFLQRDKQDITEWTQWLKQGLFRICALNSDRRIESVFIFDDSLPSLHASITRSNWHKWLKTHFEGTNETFHTLWLTKWHVSASNAFDVNTLKMVLSSIFISNFEIKSILLALPTNTNCGDKAMQQHTFPAACESLFSRLHRIQRSHKSKDKDLGDDDSSLSNEIDLYYCVASKILPSIEIRRAMVEDFDELMPLFKYRQSLDFQEKYGEFFVADLIEKSKHDKRLTTLVAICNQKPVAFVCFTTNIDGYSLRSSFFLDNFDDLFDAPAITRVEPDAAEADEKKPLDTVAPASLSASKPHLTVNTALNPEDTEDEQSNAVLISLFCVHPNYVYCTKSIATAIFNFYPNAHYLLASTVHDEAASNWLDYFHRIYARPCTDYPYDLYLTDRYALNASLLLREIDWKLDTDAIKKLILYSVPNREQYLTPNAGVKSFAVVVDFKVVGLVYVEGVAQATLSEYLTTFNAVDCGRTTASSNAARLKFMIINPLFTKFAQGIFKEVMRLTDTDVLFYEYRATIEGEPDSSVIENFVQLTPKKFVYCASSSKVSKQPPNTYALYTFGRQFYAEAQEQINHKIVIVVGYDDCAYGCIQYLITQKDLKFNNLTLIVTGDGDDSTAKFTRNLSDIEQQSLLFKSNIVSDVNHNGDYLQKLAIDNKVHIVHDNICELNVNKKTLCLTQAVCSYDVLVLANGLGPAHIMPQNTTTTAESAYENVLLISPEIPAQIAILDDYIQRNKDSIVSADDRIVIYGDFINTLCICNHLLSNYNIRGDQIVVIKCLSSTSQLFFRHEALSKIIDQQLRQLKVQVLDNAVPFEYITNAHDQNQVIGIKLKHSENIVNAMVIAADADMAAPQSSPNTDNSGDGGGGVKLKSVQDDNDASYYTLDAALLIMCQNEISWNTLNITNQDSFVVDGQIVTDDQFRTKNNAIYAIGSMAKISRKCMANGFYHALDEQLPWFQYTNAFDVGIQSARLIVENILNAQQQQQPEALKTGIDLENETCVFAKLFNGNHFFYAYQPQTVLHKNFASHMKRLQSQTQHQLSYVGFDAFGYLREILYYGCEWKSEWMKCAQLINVHGSFFGDSLSQSFQDCATDQFVNVCKVLSKTQYQIMGDDRLKHWMREICTIGNAQLDKQQLSKDAKSLIQEILTN